MIRIVIGAAEQSIAYDLQTALSEMDGVDALYVVESTGELTSAILRLDPDVVLVHDQLGPEPALQAIRDLALRRPSCAALVITLSPSTDQFAAAMDAGARGVIAYPLTFEDLQARILAAGEWAAQMRRLMATSVVPSGDGGTASRARVVTFVGAKGGVGTTTITTHLALDVVRNVSGHRVCLIDLDLEKGDVSGVLEVRHRASIADVAKVAEDMSSRAVSDAVVVHESGLHLLLTPTDVRDVEAVSPRSLREILAVLRQDYDLVLIDAGSHVTPAQAAMVELADEVVAVATPDVLAMRGLRRSITMWESLAVRKETDVRVLINRVSKQTSVSAETVRQLTRAPVLSAGLPAMFRRLEPALNARDPFRVSEDVWWRTLRAIGHEIGLVHRPETRSGQAAAELAVDGRRGRRRRDDRGSITIETMGVLPVMLVIAVLAWQVVLYGLSLSWSGHAANVAARALAVHQDPGPAARASVPVGLDMTVSPESAVGTTVRVTVRVPLLAPGFGSLPGSVSVQRQVVSEP